MNDHNLDDLIIDTIAPKNKKTKSLLTIFALLIVVLIVAIILTKTLLKSPEDTALTFEENMTEMIAPELKLQEPTEIAKPKDEPKLSIIQEEVAVHEEVKEPEVVEEVAPIVIEKEEKPFIEIEEVAKPIEVAPIVDKPIEVAPVIVKPIKKTPVKPKETAKPKSQVKKTSKKPILPKTSASGTYYIQVGSFKDSPSKRFLSVIKSSGFKYHVTSADRTGYKKLLIGPYKTRADVDKARDVVRDRIHKSAFVVQK